ncbi:hypothetical protein FPOA_11391 [Fusarium poae]|uniref:Uncharacterized protein n=1 Tax=Fusarium poae TaxID=36050 RepID=A0A1B8AGW6_FUSPO|nr:hypothetical protein FPOA_11391 [Fusarium poae]
MTLKNLVHDVIERLSSQPSPFVALDRLLLHNNLLQVSVRESDVLLHCHLLEHFVSIRSKIDAWAEENTVDEGAAWTCYINAGIRRLTQWFEASLSGHVDLNTHIPPLDVLVVWHAFLQDPVEWKRFADTTKVEFSGWNPDALSRALRNDESGEFCPSWDCMNKINRVYTDEDVRTFMDKSIDYVFSREDSNDTTQSVTRLFDSKRLAHTITTLNGEWNFTYDFHSAVQRQLNLAEPVIKFSWHRMYTSPLDNESQFRGPGCSGVTYLDIDLVWRTHILAPKEYRWFCVETFGGLVLNIPSPLGTYEPEMVFLDDTSQIYEHVFGEEYAVCLCWPCVDGRRADDPGSWGLKWFIGSVSRTPIAEEIDRRRNAAVDIPLVFGGKQCRKCGSHPRRRCLKKDIDDSLEQEPLLLGRSSTDRVLTPTVPVAAPPSPHGRMELAIDPFRDLEVSPVRSETLGETFPRSSLSSENFETSEPTLWDTNGNTIVESLDSNGSRPPTPGLSDGSTCSDDSSDEAVHRNYAFERCANLYQIPPPEYASTLRTNNRNADATRDSPRGRSRINGTTGPEPGVWLAGQTW